MTSFAFLRPVLADQTPPNRAATRQESLFGDIEIERDEWRDDEEIELEFE